MSPLAKVADDFLELRKQLLAEGDSAQYMAKIAVNSLYGVLYEAVHTYEEEIIKEDTEAEATIDDIAIIKLVIAEVNF